MAYEPHNWTCPFCGRDQVVTEAQADSFSRACHLAKTKYGLARLIHDGVGGELMDGDEPVGLA
jgi:hypothetical protein